MHSMIWQVVLDSRVWEKALPDSIWAFFFVRGGSAEAEQKVRRAHSAFRSANPQVPASHVPLHVLRPESWDEPFTAVE